METGLCQCGCGDETNIAPRNEARLGWVKGRPQRFIKGHANWKGGRKVTEHGYVMIYAPSHPRVAHQRLRCRKFVFEHILVVEQSLGHYLPIGAVVHHLNEIKADNLRSNLLPLQNDKDHADLHYRLRVLRAGGNPFTERICCECKAAKPLDAFYQYSDRPFSAMCKDCSRTGSRERQRRYRADAA